MRPLLISLTLLLIGCFPVPGPVEPSEGKLQAGADYTKSQEGRWACEGADFIVMTLAGKPALHDLDTDIITQSSGASPAGLTFRTVSGNVTKTFDVPTDRTQPAHVTILFGTAGGSFSGMQSNGSGGGTHDVEIQRAVEAKS